MNPAMMAAIQQFLASAGQQKSELGEKPEIELPVDEAAYQLPVYQGDQQGGDMPAADLNMDPALLKAAKKALAKGKSDVPVD